jgi:hypothetical protein
MNLAKPSFPFLVFATTLAVCGLTATANAASGPGPQAALDKAGGGGIKTLLTVGPSGAMFKTIAAALASIKSSDSANRYTISLAPGSYVGQVVMKPYVDLVGSGEQSTRLSAPGGATPQAAAVVRAANGAQIRSLTIITSGGTAAGVYAEGSGSIAYLEDVTVFASSGTSLTYGVYGQGTSLQLDRVTVSVSAQEGLVAALQLVGGSSTIDRCWIYAQGALGYGLHKEGSGFVVAGDRSFTGPIGAHLTSGAILNGRNLKVTGVAIGLQCVGAFAVLDGSAISAASNGGPPQIGIETSQGAKVDVHQGKVYGPVSSVAAAAGTQVRVGGASVGGGATSGAGTIKCAGVYDEFFAFFPSSCP